MEYRKATGGKPFAQELLELRKGLADGELDVSEHATAQRDLTAWCSFPSFPGLCVSPSSFFLHAPLINLVDLIKLATSGLVCLFGGFHLQGKI